MHGVSTYLVQVPSYEKVGPWCSTLYDVMLRPLAPMAVSAILWYQGIYLLSLISRSEVTITFATPVDSGENNVCKEEWNGDKNASACPPSTGGDFCEYHTPTVHFCVRV